MPEGNEEGRARAVAANAWLLEHAQDLVSVLVGLVAVIRKVLVVLSGTGTVPTPQLALPIAMVFVFVAALLAVTWFDRRWKRSEPEAPEQEIS